MESSNFDQKLRAAIEQLVAGDFVNASIAFKKLIHERPRSSVAWLALGDCAQAMSETEMAENAWQTAREVDPKNVRLLLRLGRIFEGIRKPDKALEHFEAAIAADPTAINPRISVALLMEKSNRLDEARKAVEGCFALNRDDEQARYVSALLCSRENQLEEAEHQFRKLIASNPTHQYVQYAARYELARILDRGNRFDEAMSELVKAKKLVAELVEVNALTGQYEFMAATQLRAARELPKDFLRRWSQAFPEKQREVIQPLSFLGGHPRSGTTLIEQILGSHPKVAAIDEPVVTQFAVAAVSEPPPASPVDHFNFARRKYIQRLRHVSGSDPDGKILLEKNPSPTAVLPALLQVFPELRVIIALRDPRDVILSCYFQNIPINNVNVNFLSFERLARHYSDLMTVWLAVREWDDVAWIETRYEDVVADVGKEGGRVMKFLGIEWDESQRHFFEQVRKGRLYSPTYHDVRQPIYSRSVSRWRSYEKYLAPVMSDLEPFCRAFGYEV